jgi:hypothetical protein
VQRWADEALPRLLQPVQEAVAAVTELSAGLAADVAGLAGRVEDLFERCRRAAAADSNHEERLCRLEEAGMQAPPPSDGCGELEQLQQQVQGLQRGHAQLSEGLQGLLQGQVVAAAAAAEQPWPLQASPHSQLATQQRGNAAADLTAVEEQLAAVAEQQAQQARTTEQLVSSVTTDVMALARHTKALDREVGRAAQQADPCCCAQAAGWPPAGCTSSCARERIAEPPWQQALARTVTVPPALPQVRSLRREAQQTQQALLQSCSVFSRALAIPSPVGPFTSLPPQL